MSSDGSMVPDSIDERWGGAADRFGVQPRVLIEHGWMLGLDGLDRDR
jgi:hypothetical protein